MKILVRADGVPSRTRSGHLPNVSLDFYQYINLSVRHLWNESSVCNYVPRSMLGEVSCYIELSFCVQWKSVKSGETHNSLENPLVAGFTVFSCKPYDSTQINSQYYVTSRGMGIFRLTDVKRIS